VDGGSQPYGHGRRDSRAVSALLTPSHLTIGAAAEHTAASALLLDGWWVGEVRVMAPFDFIAVRRTKGVGLRQARIEVKLVDVKKVAPSAKTKGKTAVQRLLGVDIVYVDFETGGVAITVAKARRGENTKILD
jgi:hypothetical protein